MAAQRDDGERLMMAALVGSHLIVLAFLYYLLWRGYRDRPRFLFTVGILMLLMAIHAVVFAFEHS